MGPVNTPILSRGRRNGSNGPRRESGACQISLPASPSLITSQVFHVSHLSSPLDHRRTPSLDVLPYPHFAFNVRIRVHHYISSLHSCKCLCLERYISYLGTGVLLVRIILSFFLTLSQIASSRTSWDDRR
jgi:hypothetical protein